MTALSTGVGAPARAARPDAAAATDKATGTATDRLADKATDRVADRATGTAASFPGTSAGADKCASADAVTRMPTSPDACTPSIPDKAAGRTTPTGSDTDSASPADTGADPAGSSAATGGLPPREYHARYGGRVPYVDLAARRPGAKAHPDAELLPLPFPARARAGFRADVPEGVGDLLALVYGVTRIDWRADGLRPGRPLPSGGGAYPGELYLGAAFGLCHYLPTAHALERLDDADRRAALVACLEVAPPQPPALVLVLTSRHEANLCVFGAFGHRLQALDSGVLAGQALALIEAAGAQAFVHGRFDAGRLGLLLGLDPAAESVRAVITAGPAAAEPGAVPAFSTDPGARRAGLPRRVMARRSAESFEPISVPLPRVTEILDAAAASIPGDVRTGHGGSGAALELYCLARRVDGLEPDCHRRDPSTGELVPVHGAGAAALFPAGGAGELACFQAACAVLVAGDYEPGYRVYGDRWYRMLNLYAGIAAQRIGLAATDAGLGSSLRCDYRVATADRMIRASSGRTVLLVALVGVERGAAAPGHRLMLGG